jgi:hypothetical protein
MEVSPSLNRKRDYACTMGSSVYHSTFEQDNTSMMSRRVESIIGSLDEYAMLAVLVFDLFYLAILF